MTAAFIVLSFLAGSVFTQAPAADAARVSGQVFVQGTNTPPAFRVSGRVVDENGQPIARAMVSLMGDPHGGPFMGPVGHARTGDDGCFSIADVTAGTYRVSATVSISITTSVAADGRSGGVIGGIVSGVVGGADQSTEVVVTDADVRNVRVVARRPAVQ